MENKTFWIKMFELQEKLEPVKREMNNPHFRSKYADVNNILAEVKPLCNAVRLLLLQPIIDEKVTTILIDIDNPENRQDSTLALTAGIAAQPKMAEITYFRRGTLVSLLALEQEDKDGNDTAPVTSQNAPQATETDYVAKMAQGRTEATGSKCPKCGIGTMKTSMKGSLYCSEKCWLKAEPSVEDYGAIERGDLPF